MSRWQRLRRLMDVARNQKKNKADIFSEESPGIFAATRAAGIDFLRGRHGLRRRPGY